MTSQKKLNDGVCNDCHTKYNSPEKLEAVIISRAEAGKKSSIAWLEAHGFEQQ
ncbi:MAG: hypothetical protein ABSD42_10470 [Candidatus Bathyarchaeia archaeon]|jgi:hypothetical protein